MTSPTSHSALVAKWDKKGRRVSQSCAISLVQTTGSDLRYGLGGEIPAESGACSALGLAVSHTSELAFVCLEIRHKSFAKQEEASLGLT